MTESQEGWDRLSEIDVAASSDSRRSPTGGNDSAEPRLLSQMAASWADLVAAATMTTANLGAVVLAGNTLSVAALPWAAAVACAWWFLVAAICIRVRRGTPGMLIAGVVFEDEVAGGRVGRTVIVAFIAALFLGLPLLPGGGAHSLLTAAAGRSIKTVFA